MVADFDGLWENEGTERSIIALKFRFTIGMGRAFFLLCPTYCAGIMRKSICTAGYDGTVFHNRPLTAALGSVMTHNRPLTTALNCSPTAVVIALRKFFSEMFPVTPESSVCNTTNMLVQDFEGASPTCMICGEI